MTYDDLKDKLENDVSEFGNEAEKLQNIETESNHNTENNIETDSLTEQGVHGDYQNEGNSIYDAPEHINEPTNSDNSISDMLVDEEPTVQTEDNYEKRQEEFSWTRRKDGNATNYTSQNNTPQYNTPIKPKKKSEWPKLIAMALVFGLITGTVIYGINYIGNKTAPKTKVSTSANAPKISTTDILESANQDDAKEKDAAVKSDENSKTEISHGAVADVAKNSLPALTTISTMSIQEMESFFGGTQQYEVEGAGTGVIVGQNETELLIATNNHVVEGATELTVGFIDETAIKGYVKGNDASNDLAVVAVKLEDIPEETSAEIKTITIGDSDDLQLGEQVVAIGNALGYGQSVTSGYVSALNRELELSDGVSSFTSSNLIQTDAAINSGNSGGALLNMKGELVGINEAKSSSSGFGATVDNVAYAIPISKAKPILEELMTLETKDKVAEDEKGYLGIQCVDVNQETSQRYDIPVGVYVRAVSEGSPAKEAGIQENDVITKVDGKTVTTYNDLSNVLDYCRAGEKIEIIAQRQEGGSVKEQSFTVTLGESSVIENFDNNEEFERGAAATPQGN